MTQDPQQPFDWESCEDFSEGLSVPTWVIVVQIVIICIMTVCLVVTAINLGKIIELERSLP